MIPPFSGCVVDDISLLKKPSDMLEVGQPGELPLITALKKTKGPRDPSATTSSRKSPVWEAVSLSATVLNPLIQEGYSGGGMTKQRAVGGSARREGLKKGSLTRSPKPGQPSNVEPRASWEFQRESLGDLDASPDNFRKQREELKNHLEKLGILGDNNELSKLQAGGGSGKSLLHNWRPANSNEEGDYEQVDGPFAVEGFEQQASPDIRSWLDATRDDPGACHGYGAYRDEGLGMERRVKASQKTSRMPTMVDRVLRNNAQTLSPLVLNSHDDLHKFSQSKSHFTLEEPYDNEGEQYVDEDETESDYDSAHIAASSKEAFRSYSPLGPRHTRRTSKKASSASNFRQAHVFTDVNSEVGKDNLRARPWEQEFLEYEVDSMELPKEMGKSNQRFRSNRPPKYHGAGQEAAISFHEARKMGRRKGGTSINRQYLHYASQAKRNPRGGAEPLPLLTELEDYSESEELVASSVDGEYGRPSNRELEAFKSSEGHYGRSLVRVDDKENLQLAFPECKELALCDYKPRNLSQKYRPRAFEEVVGQSIVTQALSNAISMGKIAPVYLFQGSRGTGKTSAARIFAAALICTSLEGRRPCGACQECISVAMGKCSEVKEVDAASNNGIERVKLLLEETISALPLSRYKVFIIDECHVLTMETWNALLKILEEPPMNVVFILITTDPDRLPRTAVSRCQKFPFPKIKESEIVKRLEQLAGLENLEVDADTLQLIASRSDGSLRDAETTLDQLSLLGQEISPSTVYELVGSASDEQMLSLLDNALQADTVGTVRRARELVDSGVEPLSLMSRLATLITDILAGSFKFTESQRKGFFRKQTLSEEKLEWLRMAMKTLSEAEKQLRVSNDRTTWLTAALLQLGPDRSCMFPSSCAGTSVTQSPGALDDMGENEAADYEGMSSGRQTWDDDAHHSGQDGAWGMKKSNEMPTTKPHRKLPQDRLMRTRASPQLPQPQLPEKKLYNEEFSADEYLEDTNCGQMLSSSKLDEVWYRVVERCHPAALRQLLYVHGKLISISMSEVDAIVHVEVSHPEQKSTCERAQKSIASVFKSILGFPVDVKISLASLPVENEDKRGWAQAVKGRIEQDSMDGVTGNRDIPPESQPTKAYALSHWKHVGSTMGNMGGLQSNASECFPAIPQTSFESPLKEAHYLDQWNSSNIGVHVGQPSVTTEMHDHVKPAMSHEARRMHMHLTSSMPLTMTLEESMQRHFQDMMDKGDGYRRGLEYDDVGSTCSDGELHARELDLHSPEPQEEASLGHTSQRRHGCIEGPRDSGAHCIDGRRSCDTTDLQNRKGSSLKMVRRLTMRSRTRSLPSSNPNSPDDRGSSRFATMKNQVQPQKNRDSHHLSGYEEATDFGVEASNYGAASQKKSLLKGAAGSFARFFKGSK